MLPYNVMNKASERLSTLRDESVELRFDEAEMHERLIEYESDLVYEDTIERPTLEIIDDTTIALNGIAMAVRGTRCFILNSLRLSQGFPQTGPEIREGGYNGTQAAFSAGMARLVSAFEAACDNPIIDREPGEKKNTWSYVLRPEVRIVDRRTETEDLSPKARLMRECGAIGEGGDVLVNDGSTIEFAAPKWRRRVTLGMLREFKDSSGADTMLWQTVTGEMGKAMNIKSIQAIHDMSRLTREEEDILLARKERGLIAYLSTEKDYTESDTEKIIEGVRACFLLFAHNAGMVLGYARRFSSGAVPFDELYQEGAAQLMEAIAIHPFDASGEAANFGLVASFYIKGMTKLISREMLPSVSYGNTTALASRRLFSVIEELRQGCDDIPDLETIAIHAQMSKKRVMELMALEMSALSLDAPRYSDDDEGERELGGFFGQDDFVDNRLDEMEREDAVDLLFTNKRLRDDEKIVLSLYYQVFHPSLRGAELTRKGEVKFTYPYSEEDFYSLLNFKKIDLQTLSTKVLGMSRTFAWGVQKSALRSARDILQDSPLYEEYKSDHIKNREEEDQERRQIIELALELSPSAPMSCHHIKDFHQRYEFPSEYIIKRYFGSVMAFQRACGFEPADTRHEVRTIKNQEIIERALELSPDKPLRKGDIMHLAEQGKFLKYDTVQHRFGTIAEFHRQCGFE